MVPIRGTGAGRQDHELDRLQPARNRELRGGVQGLQVVLVRSDDEHPVDADFVCVEPLDRALDLGQVLLLLEELERPRIDRLETDVHVEAVALLHQAEHLGIVDCLRPDLCAPFRGDALGNHPGEQFFGSPLVGGENVVCEEHVTRIPVELELLDHASHRVRAKGMAVHARDGAKRTRVGAAPRGGDADDAPTLPTVNQVEIRDRVGVQVPNHGPLRVVKDLSVLPV